MAFRFAVEGDLRFISHHDTMRVFERALARASLPVRFSQGFNPRPKISLPLPRPVGVASLAEILVVEFTEPVDPGHARDRLARQAPGGLTLLDAWSPSGTRALHARRVTQELPLPEELEDAVSERVEAILAQQTWPIQRSGEGGSVRTLDLRAHLAEAVVHDHRLQWTSHVLGTGSVRPAEWLTAFGLAAEDHLHRLRRIAVEWHEEVAA